MKEVRYSGPYPAAHFPDTGTIVPNGDVVDLDDETAERIVEQDGWDPVGWEPAALADLAAGTIDEVMARVGDDPEVAAATYTAEQQSDKPRKSLLERLAAIANPEG